jgi:dolichol-phosphate mannosyltransferase
LADRELIDLINDRIRPVNTSIVVEVLRLGFDPVFIPSDRPPKSGKSRWTIKKKIRLAMDTFFTSSSFPIKLITVLGLVTFVFCLILIPLLIYMRFFMSNQIFGFSIPGWTTIIAFVVMFSGINLLSLGIVAEYIWRIYEEVKDRPGFIIRKNEEEKVGKY